MPNPLYDAFGASQPVNDGGISDLINRARQLRQSFRGDPRQEVERLLATGQMTQQQFNQYSQIANRIMVQMREK